MKTTTFMGKPKVDVKINLYTLYVSTCKGKRLKWAGECPERIHIDNLLKRYISNNDYVSAMIVCKYDGGCFNEYVKYRKDC